jgi:hypothetical protein
MDIDFHFSTIYVLSRWAGFGSHNAKVIAASSQFVDDNISDDPRILATAEKMDADGRIIRYSGHELWENLLNDEGNEQVWVPYHFLPGLQGDTEEEKLVCKKNSILSIALADKLAGISMSDTDYAFKLGIGLHVLADTWAHQEFSGVITRRNIVLGLVFKNFDSELWQKVLYFIDGIASIGCNVSEPLGHAAAIHWPDRPYAAWKSQTKFVSGRNNWEEFLEACRCIYKILTNVNGGIPKELTKEQEGLLQDTFRGIFVEQDSRCIPPRFMI